MKSIVILFLGLTFLSGTLNAEARRSGDPTPEDQRLFLTYAKAVVACYEANPIAEQLVFDETGACKDSTRIIWLEPSQNTTISANAWRADVRDLGGKEFYGSLKFVNGFSQKCWTGFSVETTGEDVTLTLDKWFECDGVEQNGLASDLKALEKLILEKVRLESEQGDLTLGVSRVDLKPSREHSSSTEMAVAYEWSLLQEQSYLLVDTFKAELIGAYNEESTTAALAKVYEYLDVVERNWRPFFCVNFVNVPDEEEPASCREEVGELFKQILANYTIVAVNIGGDSYGSYEATNIYIRSSDKPEQFLRLSFDIVHEI